jgi:hypothetical protein
MAEFDLEVWKSYARVAKNDEAWRRAWTKTIRAIS